MCSQFVSEFELKALETKKSLPDEIGYLKGQNHYVFSNKLQVRLGKQLQSLIKFLFLHFCSFFQRSKQEAVEFCESNLMELIDIKSLNAVDTADLFTAFYEYAGNHGDTITIF